MKGGPYPGNCLNSDMEACLEAAANMEGGKDVFAGGSGGTSVPVISGNRYTSESKPATVGACQQSTEVTASSARILALPLTTWNAACVGARYAINNVSSQIS